MWIVDRIENNMVVLINEYKEIREEPVSVFKTLVKEGDAFVIENDTYTSSKKEPNKEALDYFNQLFKK